MAYSDAQNRASQKYHKNNMKRVPLDMQKDYYENTLKPAADRAGEPVNTFIKKAIADRIEKEK